MSVGVTAAGRALKERQRNRRLPTVDVPQVADDELARVLLSMQEHLRMYEGDSGAPKERFVTIAELEDAGMIKSDVKGRFAYISQVLEKDVAQKSGSTANPTQTDPVKADTSRQSRTPAGAGTVSSKSTATTAKLNDSSDVDVNKPAKDDFLFYDGNKFTTSPLFKKDVTWYGAQRFEKPLRFLEQVSGPTALEGLGYLWVKDGEPNTLWFTDDAGTEVQLGSAAGYALLTGATFTGLVSATANLNVADQIKVFDAGFTDTFAIKHDGSHVQLTATNTNHVKLTGYTGGFKVQDLWVVDGQTLRVYDATNADSWIVQHNGTDVIWTFTNTGAVQVVGTDLNFTAGAALRFYDASNTKWVTNNHDGTDYNVESAVASGINFDGFTSFNVSTDIIATGAVTGSNLNVSNWNTAYGWGDWASAVALKANIASPTFTGTVSGGGLQLSNWDTAYGWGDHASAGYISSTAIIANGSTVQNSAGSSQIYFNDAASGLRWRIGCSGDASDDFILYDNDLAATLMLVDDSTGNFTFNKPVTVAAVVTGASDFLSDAVGTNSDPGTDNARFSGYGILGSRSTFYVSNSAGAVALNYSGTHGTGIKLKTTNTGVDITGAPLANALGIPYHVSTGYVGGKITVSASTPGSPTKGDIWFDTT